MVKTCNYCEELFTPRRKNHKYCSPSCKTLASYKRNNYEYNPGRYVRNDEIVKAEEKEKALPTVVEERFLKLSEKVEQLSINQKNGSINANSVVNATLGAAASDVLILGARRLIAPDTLPATKGDIARINREMAEIKQLFVQSKMYFR